MRILLFTCGWLCVGLAALGVILPLLPTVPFLLLAVACFARSSERFHQWLLSHRIFGELIQQWQQTRSIPKKSKYLAVSTIVFSGGISLYALDNIMIKVALVILLSVPIVIILRLPNSEELVDASSNGRGEDL